MPAQTRQMVLLISLAATAAIAQTTLRDAAPDGFLIGGAFTGSNGPNFFDVNSRAIAGREFSIMTVITKKDFLTMKPTVSGYSYNLRFLDERVDYCVANNIAIRGHPLVYPGKETGELPWIDSLSGEELETMMFHHIDTVMQRYRGKVTMWDVVNEPFQRDSVNKWAYGYSDPYAEKIGFIEYIDKAFRRAYQNDPDAILILNDNTNDRVNYGKGDIMYQLVSELLAMGTPISGVGFQCHFNMGSEEPRYDKMREQFRRFSDLGLKLYITEFDASFNYLRSTGCQPSIEDFQRQGHLAAAALRTLLSIPNAAAFQIWGIDDNYSWLGPDSYPLLFDKNYQPKPAYDSVLVVLHEASGTNTIKRLHTIGPQSTMVNTNRLFTLQGRVLGIMPVVQKHGLSNGVYLPSRKNRHIHIEPKEVEE
jgi:endo-1,4-beta-xylanase